MAKYCPDCGDLLGGRSKCNCGWKEPSTNRQPNGSQSVPEANHNCAAHGCPWYGARSTSTNHKDANSIQWLCGFHFRFKDEPQRWPAITEDLIRNPRKYEDRS